MFWDMVSFDELDAERNELYRTQLNQMTRPMMLSLSNATRFCSLMSLPEIMPRNPGLQSRSATWKQWDKLEYEF